MLLSGISTLMTQISQVTVYKYIFSLIEEIMQCFLKNQYYFIQNRTLKRLIFRD